MRRSLKIAGTVLGALMLVMVIAALAVPYLIDLDAFEDEVAAAVQARTGRALRLGGEARLTLLPWPGVDVGRVALGNPPDFPQAIFARAERVQVRLRLLPLVLERRLVTRKVHIEGLRLGLTRNRRGVGNWLGLLPARGEPHAEADALAGLLSGRIEVRDASAHFQDMATARSYRVTNLRFQSGPVGATASPVQLALDFRGDVPGGSGRLTARAELARTAGGAYRLGDATVQASVGPAGTRLILSTEAELDPAREMLAFRELRLEAPALHVGDVRVEATAHAGAALDLTRRRLNVDGLELSANLSGQGIPGGAKMPGGALSVRADARLEGDLEEQRLDVHALHVAGMGLEARGALSVMPPWPDPQVRGTFHVAPFPPRALLKRLGRGDIVARDANALAEAELTTEIHGSAAELRLAPLRLRLDDNEIRGSVSIAGEGDPAVRFDLALENVDLDRYLALRERRPDPSAQAGPAATGAVGLDAVRAWNVAGRLRIGTARLGGAALQDVEITVDDVSRRGDGDSVVSALLAGTLGARVRRGLPLPVGP